LLKLLAILLFVTPALAQSDAYWQQLSANRAVQCDSQIVQLLKTIDELKKQLEEAKKAELPR
jgi:hypothetical protein